jgi:hypothetical protein
VTVRYDDDFGAISEFLKNVWLLEILKPQIPKVSSAWTNGSAHQIINGFRQDDPTWDTVLLQSRRNIHPVTEHIELGCYYIAEMYCSAQGDRCGCTIVFLFGDDLSLHLSGPLDRIMRTRKLDEDPVSGRLYQGPTVLLRLRGYHLAQYRHPAPVSARLVTRHQEGITDDVNEGDCSESPICNAPRTGLASAYPISRNLGTAA